MLSFGSDTFRTQWLLVESALVWSVEVALVGDEDDVAGRWRAVCKFSKLSRLYVSAECRSAAPSRHVYAMCSAPRPGQNHKPNESTVPSGARARARARSARRDPSSEMRELGRKRKFAKMKKEQKCKYSRKGKRRSKSINSQAADYAVAHREDYIHLSIRVRVNRRKYQFQTKREARKRLAVTQSHARSGGAPRTHITAHTDRRHAARRTSPAATQIRLSAHIMYTVAPCHSRP